MFDASTAAVRMLGELPVAAEANSTSTDAVAAILDQYSAACDTLTSATDYRSILSWPGNLAVFSAVSECKAGKETVEVFREKLSSAYGLYREWADVHISISTVWKCKVDVALDAFWRHNDPQDGGHLSNRHAVQDGGHAEYHRRYFQLVSLGIYFHQGAGEAWFLQLMDASPMSCISGLAFRAVFEHKLWEPGNLEVFRTAYERTM